MSFDPNTLWPYEIRKGHSRKPRKGACAMDAVSWFATGKLGDHPECACPVLTEYVIYGQDAMPNDTRQLLKPFIFRLIGSRDPSAESARTRYLVLAAVRVFAPMALDAVGLGTNAAGLRSLSDDASYEEITAAYTSASVLGIPYPAYASAAAAGIATFMAVVDVGTAAYYAAKAAAASARISGDQTEVWAAYIDALDGALNLGKQGDFDFDLVPQRLRAFADARGEGSQT